MKKPIKPSKKITIKGFATYDFNFVSKKVSWKIFQAWVKEQVPIGATDVTLEIAESKYEEDGDWTWLEISWKQRVPNPRYEKELKKYKEKIKK